MRWSRNLPSKIAIEVCTACSHRCVYCPVHDAPFAQQVMDRASFTRILDKLRGLPAIKRITLNHYNEPFQDPMIVERIAEIVARRLTQWVVLYTNAAMVTERRVEQLLPFRRWLDFSVNLPSTVSPERYRELHGRDELAQVQENVERLLHRRFRVRVNVQMNEHTTAEDLSSVRRSYGGRVRWIEAPESTTRGNLVLSRVIDRPGRIVGCAGRRHTDYLHIGVDGAVFLCPEDYFKNHVFGDLLRQSLADVLNSPKRREYIDWISGRAPAPERFLCRTCTHARVAGNWPPLQRAVESLTARLVWRRPLRQLLWPR